MSHSYLIKTNLYYFKLLNEIFMIINKLNIIILFL